MISPSRLNQGDTVLLTGASGFVGSSIADELLAQGFKVKSTGRDATKFKEMQTLFDAKYGNGKFQVVEIKDYTSSIELNNALTGTSGVIHTASDGSFGTDFDSTVSSTVANTTRLMEEAAKYSSIKAFVLTSSRVASFNFSGKKIIADTNLWFDDVIPMAKSLPNDHPAKGIMVYASSKVLGEKAAWAFIKQNKPHYSFSTILPDYVLGKRLNPRLGRYSTHSLVNDFYNGDYSTTSSFYLFTNPPSLYVDVTDVARLHVIALTATEVNQERIFALTDKFSVKAIADAIIKVEPLHQLPDSSNSMDVSDISVDNERFQSLIKNYYEKSLTTLQEAVANNIKEPRS